MLYFLVRDGIPYMEIPEGDEIWYGPIKQQQAFGKKWYLLQNIGTDANYLGVFERAKRTAQVSDGLYRVEQGALNLLKAVTNWTK